MAGSKGGAALGTSESRQSRRVLVPTSGSNNPSVQSSTSRGSREKIFIPRCNSFGIVIKPFDPYRSPSRGRRSQSRSRSRSRSKSREGLNFSSRNGSRSSISSTTSKGNMDKRKSMSLGDLNSDDELVAGATEIFQGKKGNRNDAGSLMRKLSRSPGRSKSKEALASSSSGETDFFDESKRLPLHLQRSNEFSYSEASVHQNEVGNKRGRSASESTVEVSFKLDQKRRTPHNATNFTPSGTETRSRASKHEKIKMLKMKETRMSQMQPKNELKTSNPPREPTGAKKPKQFVMVPQPKSGRLVDMKRIHDSSGEGTDLDEQPWARPADPLIHDANNSCLDQLEADGRIPPKHSSSVNQLIDNTYVNEEIQPRLSSFGPPKLPPKSFVSPPRPSKSYPHQISPFSLFEVGDSLIKGKGPPLPPRALASNSSATAHFTESGNHCLCSHAVTGTPNKMQHINAQTCEHQVSTVGGYPHPSDHVCGQNVCWARTQTPHCQHQGWSNHVCPSAQCIPLVIQSQQCSHWDCSNAFTGNVGSAKGTQHQFRPMMGGDRTTAAQGHEMHHVHSPLLDQRPNTRSDALVLAHRQFKSSANLKSDDFILEEENVRSSRVPTISKSKSTDVLTFEGKIKEYPEVENQDTSKKMKKAKSTIVLDDLSLTSENEPLKPVKSKPKLSDDKKRGRLEMWSGLVQLLTICSCLLTTILMAILSGNWDRYADSCPLYVESNLQLDRLWGNPSMIPCYLSAFFPVVIMAIALSLVFVHGGLLLFWRSERKSSSFYTKRTFSLSLVFFNFVSFCVALTVACMLTDGLRQTCLSFQFVSNIDYRPTNCQNGFNGLDLNYNIEGSFYYIIFAIVGAWLTVIFTIISFCLSLHRSGVCSCSVH